MTDKEVKEIETLKSRVEIAELKARLTEAQTRIVEAQVRRKQLVGKD